MSNYLISGVSSGLGEHLAKRLMGYGHTVTALSVSAQVPNQRTMMAARLGVNVIKIYSTIEQTRREILVESKTAPFDGMIHCAGAEHRAPLRMMNQDAFDYVMQTLNIATTMIGAAASGAMADRGGSIVLMSSVAAQRGVPGMAVYSASKAAIEGLARGAALELAPKRIRVNCVAAGAFFSPMHSRIVEGMSEEMVKAYEAKHPLGFGSIDDVGAAVLHTLNHPWMTGSVVTVDGGFSA